MGDVYYCDFCGTAISDDDYFVTNFDDSMFCSIQCAGQAADYIEGMTDGLVSITRKRDID